MRVDDVRIVVEQILRLIVKDWICVEEKAPCSGTRIFEGTWIYL